METKKKNYIYKVELKKPQIKIAEEIIDIVNNYYDLELKSKTRLALYTLPRQITHYFIKHYCNRLAEKDIAHLTGLISHATVRNSIRRVEGFIEFDRYIREDVNVLKNEIEAKIDLRQSDKSDLVKRRKRFDKIKDKITTLDASKVDELLDTLEDQLKTFEQWKQ